MSRRRKSIEIEGRFRGQMIDMVSFWGDANVWNWIVVIAMQ